LLAQIAMKTRKMSTYSF